MPSTSAVGYCEHDSLALAHAAGLFGQRGTEHARLFGPVQVHEGLPAVARAAAKRPPLVLPLAVYVGRYPLAPSFVLNVTAEGSRLFVQATGQPQLELKAEGKDRFAVVVSQISPMS